ncbi:CCA tRNA nucleotidyltransferase [Jeotgalibaca sp. MA1X17-3]|uniref:CCA tRNA nucleotidyltransferase n=1 Tax=Jeotgalibaca sp. MA1X17-3 TaxID=2908211 RepID=UPI001F26AB94|nr:CCA tRNA nucleotidyltransferase [Jeotgalibaca sp. MA1X17-3]UJF14824.1 CCA tRNA nucleotidyltransferase [Jeotgalibaca sp. MA1X17-3]
MINIQNIPEFKKAIPLIDKIEQAGYEAYFVGGGVRDTLLHLPISDVDIASSAVPDEIQRIFPITFDVGIKHGTVMVLHEKMTYEITTFRTESKYEKFRRPESVHYVRRLDEDLKRRDFTINAIALNRDGMLEDPFDGQEDIEKKLIRAVGNPMERFREDALRMMRAARFISQLGFDVEEETKQAVKDYHPLLSKIAVERIRDEWAKLLVGRNRKGGIKFFVETRLFQVCPGLQNREESLIDLALFPVQFQSQLIAWTILLYFLDIREEKVESFLKDWKLSNKEIRDIKKAYLALHHRLKKSWDHHILFDTGIEIALEVEEMVNGFGMVADVNQLLSLHKTMPIYTTRDIETNGKDVMEILETRKGGPHLGVILEDVKTNILAGKLKNNQAEIKAYIMRRKSIYMDEIQIDEYVVKKEHTAAFLGSGELDVLASPALIAFMENSCKEMLKKLVLPEETSVGTFISLEHRAPSAVGAKIKIEIKTKELHRNKYSFSLVAKENDQLIAIGEHTRSVVNREKFMDKLL